MDNLRALLDKLCQIYPQWNERLIEKRLVDAWPEVVGEGISKHAKAIRFKEEALWIEVDHPIWKNELHLRKTQILETIRKKVDLESFVLSELKLLTPRSASGSGFKSEKASGASARSVRRMPGLKKKPGS